MFPNRPVIEVTPERGVGVVSFESVCYTVRETRQVVVIVLGILEETSRMVRSSVVGTSVGCDRDCNLYQSDFAAKPQAAAVQFKFSRPYRRRRPCRRLASDAAWGPSRRSRQASEHLERFVSLPLQAVKTPGAVLGRLTSERRRAIYSFITLLYDNIASAIVTAPFLMCHSTVQPSGIFFSRCSTHPPSSRRLRPSFGPLRGRSARLFVAALEMLLYGLSTANATLPLAALEPKKGWYHAYFIARAVFLEYGSAVPKAVRGSRLPDSAQLRPTR